jgi:CubicO group peptidase (beta-lactamase class C family)
MTDPSSLSSPTRRAALRILGAGIALAAPFVARGALAAAFPGGTWPGGTPASVGLNAAKLVEAQRFAQRYGGGAGCVIRHGRLVHVWGSLTQRYQVHSSAKTWGSVLLGFAVDDGKIGLATPVRRYLPGFAATPSANLRTGWIDMAAIHHLATHTAGFPKSSHPSAFEARPGTRWIYSDGGTNWLGAAVTAVCRADLRQLCQSRLLAPLGLDGGDLTWSQLYATYGVQPTARFNGGVQANADAMARLGYLFLNQGSWNGRQIVSKAWVELSTRAYHSRVGVSFLHRYGLLWWNNATGWMSGVPRDTFYSYGKHNNHVFVIPSLDLVAVRLGTSGWSEQGGSHASFLRPLVQAAV